MFRGIKLIQFYLHRLKAANLSIKISTKYGLKEDDYAPSITWLVIFVFNLCHFHRFVFTLEFQSLKVMNIKANLHLQFFKVGEE